jgi:hypothetical protein
MRLLALQGTALRTCSAAALLGITVQQRHVTWLFPALSAALPLVLLLLLLPPLLLPRYCGNNLNTIAMTNRSASPASSGATSSLQASSTHSSTLYTGSPLLAL